MKTKLTTVAALVDTEANTLTFQTTSGKEIQFNIASNDFSISTETEISLNDFTDELLKIWKEEKDKPNPSQLTRQERLDTLTTALEGGSNYWYLLNEDAMTHLDRKVKRNEDPEFIYLGNRMMECFYRGHDMDVSDIEDEKLLGQISLASIEKGEAIMLEKYPRNFANIKTGEDDALDADIWFQLCVIGEVIYG